MAATEATAPTTVSEAASSQAPRPSPAIQVTQLASPVAPSSPRQSIEPIQVSKARPMAGAPTPTALEPVVPKPRLWSQVLGGSNVKSFSLKTKSDGDKDESKWPSLGAKGSKNGSTRNKSS
ncbi:hypothetical protein GGR51DRAFT_498614 [Nemania sp. FL0031]|nr:hypothetical protein GGR51DRAFT_498614 [Nemania sp. FL0031]